MLFPKDWTKSELVQLLIEHGFELRNEQHLELISLRDLTESLYLKKPMPVKPKIMTVMELAVATILIRRIQNKWIDYTVRKRHADEEQASLDYIRRLSNNEFNEFEEIGSLDIEALGREDSEVISSSLRNLNIDQLIVMCVLFFVVHIHRLHTTSTFKC